jgi:MFS family permease
MQSVGAAWLMVSLNAGPMYVALTQTASALPYLLLALPAGAIGDIVDRRKVMLFAEIWMIVVASVLAAITIAGAMSPMLLLILTFALCAGDAFETPTWRAVMPELVQKEELSAATSLNGIEINIARAVGPALAGLVVAFSGVGVAFVLNSVSFLGIIFVVALWKRPAVKRTAPPETVTGATVAAIRYVRYSPPIRIVNIRVGTAVFFTSALLALLPSVAHRLNGGPLGYGFLLGCFGVGAVLSGLAMQRVRSKWPAEAIVTSGIAVFGLAMIAAGAVRVILPLAVIMSICGAAWFSFISLYSIQTAEWVRARVFAVSMLVFQGAIAAGSAIWGAVAARVGLSHALLWAGIGAIATTALGLFLRLPAGNDDLTPWNHWPLPAVDMGAGAGGPVLVTVEYHVKPEQAQEFLKTMRQYGRVRRRDGASRWGICRDLEDPGLYLETFIVSSWAEHVRQHERITRADSPLEDLLRICTRGEPKVRHLVYL